MNTLSTEATTATWLAREAELKALAHTHGIGRPEQFAGKTGLQIFETMLRGEVPVAPISDTMDFMLVEASLGHAEFQGHPRFAHYNPLGTVHGGWIATLLDSAVGCAVHTRLPVGKAYTTLELKVNYVRALRQAERGARHRPGHQLRLACGHGRGAPGGPGRHAVRARHHHLPDL